MVRRWGETGYLKNYFYYKIIQLHAVINTKSEFIHLKFDHSYKNIPHQVSAFVIYSQSRTTAIDPRLGRLRKKFLFLCQVLFPKKRFLFPDGEKLDPHQFDPSFPVSCQSEASLTPNFLLPSSAYLLISVWSSYSICW